jgi:hypothetical protein
MSTPNNERANVKTKTCMNRSPTRCFIVISPRDDFKDIFIYCITLYMIRSSCFIMLLLSFMLNFNISKSQFNGLPVYQHFDFYASLSAFWFLCQFIGILIFIWFDFTKNWKNQNEYSIQLFSSTIFCILSISSHFPLFSLLIFFETTIFIGCLRAAFTIFHFWISGIRFWLFNFFIFLAYFVVIFKFLYDLELFKLFLYHVLLLILVK